MSESDPVVPSTKTEPIPSLGTSCRAARSGRKGALSPGRKGDVALLDGGERAAWTGGTRERARGANPRAKPAPVTVERTSVSDPSSWPSRGMANRGSKMRASREAASGARVVLVEGRLVERSACATRRCAVRGEPGASIVSRRGTSTRNGRYACSALFGACCGAARGSRASSREEARRATIAKATSLRARTSDPRLRLVPVRRFVLQKSSSRFGLREARPRHRSGRKLGRSRKWRVDGSSVSTGFAHRRSPRLRRSRDAQASRGRRGSKDERSFASRAIPHHVRALGAEWVMAGVRASVRLVRAALDDGRCLGSWSARASFHEHARKLRSWRPSRLAPSGAIPVAVSFGGGDRDTQGASAPITQLDQHSSA